ncbi:outer membrane beta-barrel protein, partial [Methylomonas rivi]|uniref:outer membrane beta-barrel protein n=1 Tax=Methylomonas rivi TaxID=2952226 RepID=UPI00353192EB
DYYAATLGANWRPVPWLTVRPSVRYDASDGWQAFDNNSSKRQLLISSDIVLNF